MAWIKNINKCKCVLLSIAFAFYMMIASQIPYMLDDWNWGIDAGIQSFITADQNSRYAGNLIVLLLTRSVFLKNIAMAAVFTAIPYMMVRIVGMKNDREFAIMYLLANVLILIMPVSLWRQTYGWVSGFANFVASILFLCSHILILEKYLFNKSDAVTSRRQVVKIVSILALSFAGQLFVENLSVYFVVVYFCAVSFSLIKNKKVHPGLLAAFFGTCIGVMVMFSSDLYDMLLLTGTAYDGYRKLTVDTGGGVVSMVIDIIHNFLYQSAQQVTIEFYPQTIMLLIGMTVLLILKKTKFSMLLAMGNVGMGAIYAIFWGAGVFVPYRYKILFGLFYFLTIFVEYVFVFKSKSAEWMTAAFVWLSVYGVVLPLAVTNFSGGRLLLTSYILINIFTIKIIGEVITKLPVRKSVVVCTVVIFLLLVVHYMHIYASIGSTNRTRLLAINEAVKLDTGVVYLEKYKYPEYMCGQDPVSDSEEIKPKWLHDYKLFYSIPENYEIYLMDN